MITSVYNSLWFKSTTHCKQKYIRNKPQGEIFYDDARP